jgi:hypothetical protein
MARTITAPEQIGSDSAYLANTKENQGVHLMTVVAAYADEKPTKDGKEPYDGICFVCECYGGNNHGKQFTLKLIDGKLSHKDEGKNAFAKQAAFLIAADCMTPDQLGKSIDYEVDHAVGSMLFLDLVLGKEASDGKQYLDLNYMNVYHVDDPRARKFPLDAKQKERIEGIKPDFRHKDEAYFAKLVAKKEHVKKEQAAKADFSDL